MTGKAALAARVLGFKMGDLGIDHQPDGRCECRPLCRRRQPGNPERPAKPHIAAQNPPGHSDRPVIWLAPPVSTMRLPTSVRIAGLL
jgi:hypothetical protein